MATAENMRNNYLDMLEKARQRYVKKLEKLFGPRDPRFVFRSFERSTGKDGEPRNWFPDDFHLHGDCAVNIQLCHDAWDNLERGRSLWQLAHECTHFLEPKEVDKVTFLEEGLATWFQCEPRFHNDVVKEYLKWMRSQRGVDHYLGTNYSVAREHVSKRMKKLGPLIREIRAKGQFISDVGPETLKERLKPIDNQIVERLCSVFLKYK